MKLLDYILYCEPHQEISHELGVVIVQVEHGLHAVGLAM